MKILMTGLSSFVSPKWLSYAVMRIDVLSLRIGQNKKGQLQLRYFEGKNQAFLDSMPIQLVIEKANEPVIYK
jgi:hypothetical protein